MRPGGFGVALATVAVVGAAAGAQAARAGRSRPPGAGAGEANRGGPRATPVPILPESEFRRAMGKHRGQVVVLHFWATWCIPCLHELPLIDELTRAASSRGVKLLSISLDDPTAEAARYVGRVMNEHGVKNMTRAILKAEPGGFAARIDPRWQGDIPAFFAYTRQGALKRAFIGEMSRAHFDNLVRDLVAPAAP